MLDHPVRLQLPERFDLEYIGEDGKAHQPVMVHRALLGSLERFFGVLIEHYAGAFPVWLAPVQAVVIPVAERHQDYARAVPRRSCARRASACDVDDRNEKLGYKIREAQVQKVPYMLVVGDKEVAAGTVSVRHRQAGDLGATDAAFAGGEDREARRGASDRGRSAAGRSGRCPIDPKSVRINDRIRAKEIRVIDDDGSQLGIMPPEQALMIAEEKGLDLVEIAPTAAPPVCRIMNSGKFFYQQAKRETEARKHQRHIQVKEVKFRPKIDEHDFQFKKRNVERFLLDGNKVKSTVIFRGREMAHNEIGRRILNRLAAELPRSRTSRVAAAEGMTMVQILAPKKEAPAKPKPAKKADEGTGKAKADKAKAEKAPKVPKAEKAASRPRRKGEAAAVAEKPGN